MADRSLLPTLLDSLLSAFLPGSSALRIAAELRQAFLGRAKKRHSLREPCDLFSGKRMPGIFSCHRYTLLF